MAREFSEPGIGLSHNVGFTMNKLTFLIVCVLAAGCGKNTPMVIEQDHPANPDAAAATPAQESLTLSVAPTSRPMDQITLPMDHSSHGMISRPPQQNSARSATTEPALSQIYVCPMHGDVRSAQPGKCPKCGMALRRDGGK